MISPTTFFGLSLRTRRQRRLLVAAYVLLTIAYLLIALHVSRGLAGAFLPMTITVGGLLGGIRSGGPVKSYERPSILNPDFTATTSSYPVQTLNLSDIRSPSRLFPLDEREQAQRDHAHYTAYRILRWLLGVVTLSVLFLLQEQQRWMLAWYPVLLWCLLIVTLSLPQCVILWTEPDPPAAGDLTLVPDR